MATYPFLNKQQTTTGGYDGSGIMGGQPGYTTPVGGGPARQTRLGSGASVGNVPMTVVGDPIRMPASSAPNLMNATNAPVPRSLDSANVARPGMVYPASSNVGTNGYTVPSNANPQAPITAPNYMGPGPVLTPGAQPNNWANRLSSIDANGAPRINYTGNQGTGVTGNYDSSGINWNGGAGYSNPGNHNQLVQQSIDAFSDQGGAYLSNATRRGLETAGSRGLLNSSIAAGAANRSAIEAMQPYVQQSVDLAKTREGWAFQSGENALDRSLQVAVENGRLSQSMAELLATHTFQGNQAAFDRTLQHALAQGQIDSQTFQLLKTQQFQNSQNALDRGLQAGLQQGRIDADTASQLRGFGFQGMQNSLDRTQQSMLQNQQYAFQGEQAALDRTSRAQLQSDATFQQDWLSSRNFSREFQSQLSMIPLSAAADLTSFISKYAVENPDIYTPEIINGMSNFMAQNMRSILSQYFPNQTSYTSTSYDGSGINPPGGLPPIQAMGGNP